MKFAQELFPRGSYPRQETDGLYIDETKARNFDVIAESMHKDIFPIGIYSGDNTSGTGKSTCITQDACYLTWKINQIYGLKNTFTSANVFFQVDKLIKDAPKFAKEQPYSVLVLDEPDDLNEHQLKNKSFELRSAFRKLRQLNLIFLITSHSFFELPKFYALNRAQYLINVRYHDKFNRGYFKFYGPKAKKLLYFKGKKEWDYDAHKCDLEGRFGPSYAFFPNCSEEIAKYKRKKYLDMVDELSGKNRPKEVNEKEITRKLFRQIHENCPEIQIKTLAKGFAVSERTCFNWLSENSTPSPLIAQNESADMNDNKIILTGDEDVDVTSNPQPNPIDRELNTNEEV